MNRLLALLPKAEPRERSAVLWSFAYFFCVLCAYYILRPLRDEMGVTIGAANLQWLFLAVFVVMLAIVPIFGWVVSRFARRKVAPIIYAFFVLNLVLFWLAFQGGQIGGAAAIAFFVWVSVFNLIAVSLFWSVMSDLWDHMQAKRLYGVIAAGGSAGALAGPILTQSLVHALGPTNLPLVSAVFLTAALLCVTVLSRRQTEGRSTPQTDDRLASGLFAGASRVLQSPYLRKIAFWVLLANLIGTFFYLEQARIVGNSIAERSDRVQLFARMDLAVNVLAALGQTLLTARIVQKLGVGASAAVLPVAAACGLIAVAAAPVLAVIVGVLVIERTVTFAIANPAMRVLYTVVAPADKYKAQNFVDTVVFRGGDAASGWLLAGLTRGLGAPMPMIAVAALPLAAVWFGLSLVLGKEQAARANATWQSQARTPDQ